MEGAGTSVLVLGGSNFMGRTLLFALANIPNTTLACINRGNSYWGDEHLELQKSERVKFFVADRKNHLQFADALRTSTEWCKAKNLVGSTTSPCWHLVIDFSAYTAADLDPVLHVLAAECSLYVYISTDSVYEVCDPANWQGRAVIEEDSQRCVDPKLQAKRSSLDPYGEGKLQVEEKLLDIKLNPSIPFLSLRLPDVIGPYDVSDRFWGYLLWISSGYPVHVQRNTLENELSFVYSADVVTYLLQLLNLSKPQLATLNRQILNISIPEPLKLFDLLVLMKRALTEIGSGSPKVCHADLPGNIAGKIETHESGLRWLHTDHLDKIGRFLYPSVTCGPIDCSKGLQHPIFRWKSSSWPDIIKETVEFFVRTAPSYASEYADAIKTFEEIIQDCYPIKKGSQ